MEKKLTDKFNESQLTLSEYDKALDFYKSRNFWEVFDKEIVAKNNAITLLREFCIVPYKRALEIFRKNKAQHLIKYIEELKNRRVRRVENIQRRTVVRSQNVFRTSVPQNTDSAQSQFVFFDFAYHQNFYNLVCGENYINQLATDPKEQEVVRQTYAQTIAEHSHKQMMQWFERFVQQKIDEKAADANRRSAEALQQQFNQNMAEINRRFAQLESKINKCQRDIPKELEQMRRHFEEIEKQLKKDIRTSQSSFDSFKPEFEKYSKGLREIRIQQDEIKKLDISLRRDKEQQERKFQEYQSRFEEQRRKQERLEQLLNEIQQRINQSRGLFSCFK